MSTATFLCWVGWLVVLYYLNPEEAGFVGFLCFYLSLFCALVGTFSLLGFFVRVWFSREPIIFRHLGVSTRQSFWFAMLLVATLMMQGAGFLRWWNALLLIIFLIILEFFFLSRKVMRRY